MRLTEETINEIRNSASISEVIGHYIPLIKKGKGFTALCPFHDDHDPSLSISDDKQIYKCFVCGNGGNVFNFVMNFKKISFPESVKEVADIIGKPIDIDIYSAPKKVKKYQNLYDLLNTYIEETNYLLTSTNAGKDAISYLENRGINKDLINTFKIGYNPQDDFMYKYLHESKISDEDMIQAGICRMMDRGVRDIFYNRIVFPIYNELNDPVAFTARDFKGDSDSKYINSADSVIYTKGDILYNFNLAKDYAKKVKNVFVVEGVMDVIAFYKAGINNVVATLGTALTKKQALLLQSLKSRVTLCYDGDKAGQAANLKNGEILLKNGFSVSVVNNDTNLDPDEIINKNGVNTLRDMCSKPFDYLNYVIKYYKNNLNLDNFSDKKEMFNKVSMLISYLKDRSEIDYYNKELYDITKISAVSSINSNKKEYNIERKKEYHYSLDGLTKAEYSIIVMSTIDKNALVYYQKNLGYLIDPNNEKLISLINEEYKKNGICKLSKLIDNVDDKMKNLITTIAVVDGLPDRFDKELMDDAISKVKRGVKLQELKKLEELIEKYKNIDYEKTIEYMNKHQELVRELGGSVNGKY